MSFDYAEAVYQEADVEQAELEAQGREAARLRRAGVCTHGWRLGGGVSVYSAEDIARMREQGNFPDRPTDPRVTDQASIPEGLDLCTHCGQLVQSWESEEIAQYERENDIF